ncbi:MAG: hypothetical protein RLY86_2153 [Pseudomonadota bacterium]|jgi:heme exporter protein D
MVEFFAMGGYALYVWSSYGLAVLVLAGLFASTILGLRAQERTLAALETAQVGRRRRNAARPGRGGDAGDGAAVAVVMIAASAGTTESCGGGDAGSAGAVADGGC